MMKAAERGTRRCPKLTYRHPPRSPIRQRCAARRTDPRIPRGRLPRGRHRETARARPRRRPRMTAAARGTRRCPKRTNRSPPRSQMRRPCAAQRPTPASPAGVSPAGGEARPHTVTAGHSRASGLPRWSAPATLSRGDPSCSKHSKQSTERAFTYETLSQGPVSAFERQLHNKYIR